MDELAKELQTFLVRLHYEPNCVSDKVLHYMEHLLHLLQIDDEKAVLHYYGIFYHEHLSLQEIAQKNHLSPENMLKRIDNSIRKLAVSPEWQMIKNL
ncbi:MAG: hypothetical protein IJV27_03170 [Prevotella sp.]|nr:hypothetical protein [Prevotella sp.]